MLALSVVGAAVGRQAAFDAAAFWSHLLGLPGQSARVAGLVIHLLVSIGVAAGYGLGFTLGGVADSGWAWGLVGGVIHWVAAGVFIAIVPVDGEATATASPGPFGRRLGPSGSLGFLAAHLVFGLVAGFTYLLLHSSAGIDAAL